MTELEKDFPFRGRIQKKSNDYPGKRFHIVGRFTEIGASRSHNSGPFKNSDLTKEEIRNTTYVMCSNQFKNGDNFYQRLYFSSDPHDYQIDKSSNSFNLGAVPFIYEKQAKNINLYYKNTLKKNSWNSVTSDTIELNLTDENNKVFYNFEDNTYNLGESLYYSVPYQVTEKKNNGAETSFSEFLFRGTSLGSIGTSTYFPANSFEGTCFRLSNTENVEIYDNSSVGISGEPGKYYITIPKSDLQPESSGGVCILTDYRFVNNVVLKISEGTSQEYVLSDFIGQTDTSVIFNIKNRSLYAGEGVSSGINTVTKISAELRNSSIDFKKVSSENFNFYLIPEGDQNYFSGMKKLENFALQKGTGSGSLKYFSVVDGANHNIIYSPTNSNLNDLNEGYLPTLNMNSYFSLVNFYVFFISGKLNTNWYSDTPSTKIAKNGNPLQAFTWSDSLHSLKGFMYDYCTEKPLTSCGKCYGLNSDGEDSCWVTNKTLGVLNGTLSTDDSSPLNGTNRKSGVNRELYFWWFFGIVLLLIGWWSYLIIMRINFKRDGTSINHRTALLLSFIFPGIILGVYLGAIWLKWRKS